MKKKFFICSIALLPLVVLSAEPSAYGTIDSNSISSKEIISQDVNSYQTTPNVPVPSKSIRYSEPEASSSNSSEQYEGVRSVLQSYETKISKQDARIRELEDEMGKLKGYVEESRKIQLENQEKVKIVLAELSTLIDSINKNYVSKEKFDQLANELKGSKTVSSKQTATTPSDAANTTPEKEASSKTVSAKELSQKDSATLMKEADDLFETKAYANAEVMYKELLNRNYKPAKANFSLGEIAYSKKSYAMAIEYYKTSISLFDKAPYIPTLLYHTGASFEKLGKAKEAQGFYKALKENYPTSPEAKKVK